MTRSISYQQERTTYSLEDFLSDEVRQVIQRTIQEGRGTIREGYLRRNSASDPEFFVACEIAESSGLIVTI